MKTTSTAVRFIAVCLGIASSVAAGEAPSAGGEAPPRTRSRLARWVAVLTLAIALAPGVASAQEDGTITISSTFYMDWLSGSVGPDLAEIYANGHEHTWKLTLRGTTQSHETFTSFGVSNYVTEIHATSFDLEFSGPDAATLNGIVSDHLAGGDVVIYLRNAYASGFGDDFAIMYVWPMGPDVEFFAGHDTFGSDTLFPTDVDGYPVVGPEPFSIWTEYSELSDRRPGNDGSIGSWESLVTFAVMPDTPPLTISGLFSMDNLYGELHLYNVAPELLTVYTNGHEHTWTLTLHGTTQSHSGWVDLENGMFANITEIEATSFDLEFFGPDAATLNGFVSDQLAGQNVYVHLQNTYSYDGWGFAIMQVGVGQSGTGNSLFYSGHDIHLGNDTGVDTLFPTDADGYPVVGPEPFSIKPDYTALGNFDLLSGTGGAIVSVAGLVTFEVMPAAPTLTITHSNNVVIVSWPSPSTGFSLQQINQLNTTNWVTSTETVTDTGTIKFITVDPPMGSRFYRLFKP